jgi:hypothetical protein
MFEKPVMDAVRNQAEQRPRARTTIGAVTPQPVAPTLIEETRAAEAKKKAEARPFSFGAVI